MRGRMGANGQNQLEFEEEVSGKETRTLERNERRDVDDLSSSISLLSRVEHVLPDVPRRIEPQIEQSQLYIVLALRKRSVERRWANRTESSSSPPFRSQARKRLT